MLTGAAAFVTAVGTLIGSLAAAGVIGGGNDAQSSITQKRGPPKTRQPTAPFPGATADESKLYALIPSVLQPDCGAYRDIDIAAKRAVLKCDPVEVTQVVYVLFGSARATNDYFKRQSRNGDTAHTCEKSLRGLSIYSNAAKQPIGRLLCFVDRDTAWIEWTNVPLNVYAYASAPAKEGKALFPFWLSAGPNPLAK
jgi:hypothetical protein